MLIRASMRRNQKLITNIKESKLQQQNDKKFINRLQTIRSMQANG
ncbi:unnamed protein product [Paramecium octaurelia]|uniref:Uncharacterized protein n=1 Tax=Paramecium octaurelia TaxID=43137 RepID=A0A8S1XHY3_PAROT|nr:unnamed protein product [Paramecium octaurelia]